jgi:glutamine synthetase adenylyltransferase
MTPLTIDTLRTLAQAQGLDLTDQELAGLLPLVEAGRALMASMAAVPLADVEPAVQYRIL